MPIAFKIWYSLVVSALLYTGAAAQYKLERPVVVSVDKEHGLPTNDMRSVRKGKNGFMWMGSTDGLCRFDGQQVKVYRQQDDPALGPFDNAVNFALPLDEEIWMGTSQGVSVLNLNTDRFRHYQLGQDGKLDSVSRRFDQSVTHLYLDRQGDIWLATRDRGAWLYNRKTDNFKRFDFSPVTYSQLVPLLGSNTTVLSIKASETNDSIVWVGTAGGLQEINKYSGKVAWYTYAKADKDYQVSLNAFRRLYHHDDGLVYVGSWGAGVNVFDPVNKTFTPLVVKKDEGAALLTGSISNLVRKSKDEIWITSSLGLVVYNSLQKAVTWYKVNQPLQYRFYGIDYIDDANRIWYADINGIQYFDPVMQQFSTHSYEHLFNKQWAYSFYILSDPSGRHITVCPRVTDGMFHFDKQTGQWTKSTFTSLRQKGIERLIVRGFVELEPGVYMISADEGLFTYSIHTKRFDYVTNTPKVAFKRWGEIVKDASGNLWLALDAEGLLRWNRKTHDYRLFRDELLSDRPGEGVGRPNNLYRDSRNNIWFTRSGGFSVHLAAKDSIINFLYSDNPVNSFPFSFNFAEDRMHRLWISSGDSWYGYIDLASPEKGIVKKFDLREKNIDGHFTYLAQDKEGNVWGYAAEELVKINADDMSLTTFNFDYGVKTPDFFHFSFLPSGDMIFGGRNNIVLANPAELKRNTERPSPYITKLNLLNRPVDLAGFLKDGQLELKYHQNFLSIFFSARAYTMPAGVKFRYRLKEFDDWVESGAERMANYTNIPSGHYVFQLQAANNEGAWNEEMLELPVHIATPWWQAWWFRAITILAIAALTYWLYRFRISQVRKKEKMKSQYEKKLANVEMTALLAQMNPHFLFNSLNSIDSYIIKNESGKASEYLNNFARLMRLILQNSRSNYISLRDELEALDLYLQMEGLRFKDKFQYEIIIDPGIDPGSYVIPPMLLQPYVENAIWHGLMHKNDGTTRRVEIRISQENNNLVCTVQDNGIGRQKAQELKAHKTGNRKRSMGMQITRDRIEMINKLYNSNTSVEITDLHDETGKPAGTRVALTIPV